jgi:hypothetical protein
MTSIDDYSHKWKGYKTRKRAILAMLFLFAPTIYFIIKPLSTSLNTDLPITIFVLSWFFTLLVLLFKLYYFTCPRCGNLFYIKGLFGGSIGIYTKKCVHCGLMKWSLKDGSNYDEAS